jgi:hypothetical protein
MRVYRLTARRLRKGRACEFGLRHQDQEAAARLTLSAGEADIQ